jgi:hypothetical protein
LTTPQKPAIVIVVYSLLLFNLGLKIVAQTAEQMFLDSRGFGSIVATRERKFVQIDGVTFGYPAGDTAIEAIVRLVPHWEKGREPHLRAFVSLDRKRAEIVLTSMMTWEGKEMEVWQVLSDISKQRYLIRRKEILSLLIFVHERGLRDNLSQCSEQKMFYEHLYNSLSRELQGDFKFGDKVLGVFSDEETLMKKVLSCSYSQSDVLFWLGEYRGTDLDWYLDNGIPLDNGFSAETVLIEGKALFKQVPRNVDFVRLPKAFAQGEDMVDSTIYIAPIATSANDLTNKSNKPVTTWMSKVALLSNMALDEILEDVKFIPGPPKF